MKIEKYLLHFLLLCLLILSVSCKKFIPVDSKYNSYTGKDGLDKLDFKWNPKTKFVKGDILQICIKGYYGDIIIEVIDDNGNKIEKMKKYLPKSVELNNKIETVYDKELFFTVCTLDQPGNYKVVLYQKNEKFPFDNIEMDSFNVIVTDN